jgi:hypothetical protein
MACPDFSLSPGGRMGVGVLQARSGLDYPLVAPSEDVRYLLADFYLTYEQDAALALPLRVKHIYNIGCVENTPAAGFPTPVNAVGIVVVDAADTVVFNSISQPVTGYDSWGWGSDYTVFEWLTPTAACRLVIYKTWAETDDNKRDYDKYLTPTNADLDARTIYKIPKRVQQISVKNGTTLLGPYRGNIEFNANYNTTLAVGETTAERFVARLQSPRPACF